MSKDPYRYFRVEGRELLDTLAQGVLELEKSAAPATVARLLRAAHTLKGASRVVKQVGIADLAHALEELLAEQRASTVALSTEAATRLLSLLDQIDAQLTALSAPAESVQADNPQPPEDRQDGVRIQTQEVDALLHLVSEAGVRVAAARQQLSRADRARELAQLLAAQLRPRGASAESVAERVASVADELEAEIAALVQGYTADVASIASGLAEVEDAVGRLRLIPAATIFPALDRAVRDAATAVGSQVDFTTAGGEVRLDTQVLASLRAALMHAVRNAVAHGIEARPERVAAGKPPRGRIGLSVERRGGRVTFRCQDDGRGVDVEAVRSVAVRRGVVQASAAASLSSDHVLSLLGSGGLTTESAVTDLSGRGVGLDVVRATAQSLKGEFRIRSEAGRGATVEVEVPVSVASMTALLVEYAEGVAAIPLDAVRQVLRVRDDEIARTPEGLSLIHDGSALPFLDLDRALSVLGAPRIRAVWSVVVVGAGGQAACLGVHRLRGAAGIVMRTLPAFLSADPLIAGAAVDEEGNPRLILDPHGLVHAATDQPPPQQTPAPGPARVLVVDDSLTTRMLEQSILESAGYLVELAVSAEEGLTKARAGRFSLFLVDVEMPGMDGFGFVREVRSDPALRDTPAILVTSRNAPEDRQKGQQVGASAYIVKGEFDQKQLLRTIGRLVGAP